MAKAKEKFLTKKNILDTLSKEDVFANGAECAVSACFTNKGKTTSRWDGNWFERNYPGVKVCPKNDDGERKPSLKKGEYLPALSYKFESEARSGKKSYESIRKGLVKWVEKNFPDNYRERIA